jgi:carbonic anhydrase
MKKKLFLLCPASHVEHFLIRKYKDAYFLTALAAVFRLKEYDGMEKLLAFIQKEGVQEVIVVNDISCLFIKSVISRHKGFGTHAEQVLVDLLIDNYHSVMRSASEEEQCYRLAELNVQRQIEELLEIDCFLQQVVLQKIKVKGLVTSKAENRLAAVRANELAFAL